MTQKKAPGKIDQVTVLTNPVDISSFINAVKKTIVLFEMTGCPYCRAFEPRFFDQVDSRPGDCRFLKVRLDDHHNPLWQKT